MVNLCCVNTYILGLSNISSCFCLNSLNNVAFLHYIHAVCFLSSAPSAPPAVITLDMHNSSALLATWQDVPLIHQNGIILGYQIQLQQEEGGPIVWNVTLGSNDTSFHFTDLSIFQNYSLQVKLSKLCICEHMVGFRINCLIGSPLVFEASCNDSHLFLCLLHFRSWRTTEKELVHTMTRSIR